MSFYNDLEKRKERVREYLKNNPTATSREIKLILHTKIDKVYIRGMAEAYQDAGINPPRTFKRMTLDEKKKIVIDYIRKNPGAGGHTIVKATKISFLNLFKNTEEAYTEAGVSYPRREKRELMLREREFKRMEIIRLLRNDPLISIAEIGKKANTHPYTLFKNMKEIYQLAGIPFLSGHEKRRIAKRNEVISFIRGNNFATQREINKACKTHVQLLFERGIFGAYEKAGVEFPFERLKLHGTVLKEIKDNAKKFEVEIASKLSSHGSVNRLVRTKRGFADIIFERKGKKVAIELKNYLAHEISISQVKQLNKYLEDIGSNLGFLICLKKPKKDTFLIGESKIMILKESELDKIPAVMDL